MSLHTVPDVSGSGPFVIERSETHPSGKTHRTYLREAGHLENTGGYPAWGDFATAKRFGTGWEASAHREQIERHRALLGEPWELAIRTEREVAAEIATEARNFLLAQGAPQKQRVLGSLDDPTPLREIGQERIEKREQSANEWTRLEPSSTLTIEGLGLSQ